MSVHYPTDEGTIAFPVAQVFSNGGEFLFGDEDHFGFPPALGGQIPIGAVFVSAVTTAAGVAPTGRAIADEAALKEFRGGRKAAEEKRESGVDWHVVHTAL